MRGNAHRHASASLAVVHNGIIENFNARGDELSNRTIDIAVGRRRSFGPTGLSGANPCAPTILGNEFNSC
jgi:hypothetical protein